MRTGGESDFYVLNGTVFIPGVKVWALGSIRSLWRHSGRVAAVSDQEPWGPGVYLTRPDGLWAGS